MEQNSDSGLKDPLLKASREAEQRLHSRPESSEPVNYLTINASGPQLCYSPLLSCNDDIDWRSATPSSESEASGEEYEVYPRRWYILILFSLMAATQGAVWNTWGPISSTAEEVFGWGDSTIALLSNWGPISYLVGGIFFSWALDVKGLRLACLLTALLIALGTAIRCITTDPPAVTWLMHVGQALNGLAGPVAMAGPPAVSAAWFPPNQRATATAVGALFGMMGSAAGFVFGPLLVPDVPGNSTNTSTSSVGNVHDLLGDGDYPESMGPDWGSNLTCDPQLWSTRLNSKENRINREKKDIRLYIYIEAGWSLGLFLLILIYFPRKPPLPPCASATMQRESFFRGLQQLFVCRRPQFWAICFVYGVSVGVFNVWAGVLDVILKPHGIGEKEAGWIGFYAVCGGAAMSLIVARFADVFSRVMKWLLLFFYVIGTGAFTVFLLAAKGVIPASTVILYSTIITGSTALNAAVPLMFELACELAYPTGEGTTNGVLTIVNNLFGLIFLFVFMIPDIGSMWTNYVLVAASGVCLPLLMVMKEEYNRLEIDEHNPSLNAEIVIAPPDD